MEIYTVYKRSIQDVRTGSYLAGGVVYQAEHRKCYSSDNAAPIDFCKKLCNLAERIATHHKNRHCITEEGNTIPDELYNFGITTIAATEIEFATGKEGATKKKRVPLTNKELDDLSSQVLHALRELYD